MNGKLGTGLQVGSKSDNMALTGHVATVEFAGLLIPKKSAVNIGVCWTVAKLLIDTGLMGTFPILKG